MSKSLIIVAVSLIAVAGGFIFLRSPQLRERTEEFVAETILGKETPLDATPGAPIPSWIYLVADPTDIEDHEYAIPRVDTGIVCKMLDWQIRNGGGRFWLTYIDNRSQDNEIKYFPVPSRKCIPAAPQPTRGETSFDFTQRKRAYEAQKLSWSADSARQAQDFESGKRHFLVECQTFLSKVVYVSGSPTHRHSDVIGCLNAAFRSLSIQSGVGQTRKYIVAFSDLVHNVKNSPPLNSVPDDVKIISVNPVPGSSGKITQAVTEVDHPLRIFELLSRPLKVDRGDLSSGDDGK